MGKKKKLVNKKGINYRFWVLVLVLAAGVLTGTKLIKTKQEGSVAASTVYVGTPLSVNSHYCRINGGVCATFSTASDRFSLYEGSCSVNGKVGSLMSGMCPGDWRVSCCNTGNSCYVGGLNGFRVTNGTKLCNTSSKTRVYTCDTGSIIYKGGDCASLGKICEKGSCVTKLSGTSTGAEKCVAKGGNCQAIIKSTLSSISAPQEGTTCMVGNKLGVFQSSDSTGSLCSGQYLTGYRCCVPLTTTSTSACASNPNSVCVNSSDCASGGAFAVPASGNFSDCNVATGGKTCCMKNLGKPYTNTTGCSSIAGAYCADFPVALNDGYNCMAHTTNGQDVDDGRIVTGRCNGDSTVRCCAPNKY